MQKAFSACALLLVALIATGCSFPGVYRIDVQQGNIIEADDLEALNPTMTRSDIRNLLGTPITVSTFRPDREYYIYTLQERGGSIEKQRVTIVYEDNRYLRHEASLLDETPAN